MARFGPELMVEEEEPVGGCSHVELPIGADALDCLPIGTILREPRGRQAIRLATQSRLAAVKIGGEFYTS
jgi:hypothetical protein